MSLKRSYNIMIKLKLKYQLLILTLVLQSISNILYGQNKDNEKLKTELIYKLPKYIFWSVNNDMEIRLGVLGASKTMMKELSKLEKKRFPYGKSFKVIFIMTPEEASEFNTEMLYVSKQYIGKYEEISKKTRANKTLLITEDYEAKKFIMINFNEKDDEFTHEINARNISEGGMTISDKIKSTDAIIIDDRFLFQESEENLRKEKQKVKEQKEMLENQEITLKYQQKKLDRQIEEIDKQRLEIDNQQKRIQNQ